jgi:ATP-dependent exoDNAse (exonuclease V) beta subunit
LYTRHEGGVLTRALGTAVHALLEELAHLSESQGWPAAQGAIASRSPRIAAQIRAAGVDPAEAESLARQARDLAIAASRDPHGQWILVPHPNAASEAAWSGVVDGAIRTVRVDRIFRAGLEPLTEGTDAWWIVDYKTAHAEGLDPAAALPELRRIFAPQLEAYAAILRQLHGAQTPMRAALYYPRMALLDWWNID